MQNRFKKKISELCLFYNGETENPFADITINNYRHYWNYECSFFSDPDIFINPDIDKLFKNHMINALDGYLAESCMSLDKAIKDYFANGKDLVESLKLKK